MRDFFLTLVNYELCDLLILVIKLNFQTFFPQNRFSQPLFLAVICMEPVNADEHGQTICEHLRDTG